MPRFYFDTVVNGVVYRDEEGDDFPDAAAAIQDAKVGAAEYVADVIASSGTPDHEEKIVRTESGETVARFLITEALSVSLPDASD